VFILSDCKVTAFSAEKRENRKKKKIKEGPPTRPTTIPSLQREGERTLGAGHSAKSGLAV
jgi:hypothetical protein